MKTLKLFVLASLLSICLSSSTFAGDMYAGFADVPPPPPAAAASTGGPSGATDANYLFESALLAVQTVLSLS